MGTSLSYSRKGAKLAKICKSFFLSVLRVFA